MMLELLRNRGREPVTFASWQDFLASDAPLGVGVAELGEGLRFAARKITLVTSTELGMERPKQRQRRRRARDPETVIRELTDLLIGAPVVHEDHGVGRYRGPHDARRRRRAHGVPAARVRGRRQAVRAGAEPAPRHALQRRVARGRAAAQARLGPVGEGEAQSGRGRARHGRRAPEPLRAARRARRHANGLRGRQLPALRARSFRSRRPRTSSRRSSACSRTSRAAKPMDRVVCGDVGFGKTEVALRSAFVTVQAGFQVAVLVPTTLLAEQHHRTFQDRFAEWPVRIELLSRFRSARGVRRRAQGARGRHGRHRDRHAQAAAARSQVQAARPRDRRRGAPLRREAQGAPEAAARRGRHADAHRDADPAHAEHDARRLARPLDHRDAARRPARGEDVRRRVERPPDPRGRAARDSPRRADLLRAQPRREHRGDAPSSCASSCRKPTCASRTARCRSASSRS